MRIVSLEDDESFWELLEEALMAEYGNEMRTEWLRSESEFVAKLADYASDPPDVFLLDVMVKWADAAECMPEPPDDVRTGTYHRAGVRCRNRLLQYPTTAQVPVIFYTVLDRADIDKVINDFPPDTAYVRKDVGFDKVIRQLDHIFRRRSRW